jgi:hypothetical protein
VNENSLILDGISKSFPIHHGRDMRLILDDISLEKVQDFAELGIYLKELTFYRPLHF